MTLSFSHLGICVSDLDRSLRFYCEGLGFELVASHRVGEEFARRMLDQTIPAYDSLPDAREMAAVMEQASFLEKALFVAGHFGWLAETGSALGSGRRGVMVSVLPVDTSIM